MRRRRKGEAASAIKRHSAVGVCCDGASWLGPGADAEVRYPSESDRADQGPEARETERRVEDARNATHGLKLDQASACHGRANKLFEVEDSRARRESRR